MGGSSSSSTSKHERREVFSAGEKGSYILMTPFGCKLSGCLPPCPSGRHRLVLVEEFLAEKANGHKKDLPVAFCQGCLGQFTQDRACCKPCGNASHRPYSCFLSNDHRGPCVCSECSAFQVSSIGIRTGSQVQQNHELLKQLRRIKPNATEIKSPAMANPKLSMREGEKALVINGQQKNTQRRDGKTVTTKTTHTSSSLLGSSSSVKSETVGKQKIMVSQSHHYDMLTAINRRDGLCTAGGHVPKVPKVPTGRAESLQLPVSSNPCADGKHDARYLKQALKVTCRRKKSHAVYVDKLATLLSDDSEVCETKCSLVVCRSCGITTCFMLDTPVFDTCNSAAFRQLCTIIEAQYQPCGIGKSSTQWKLGCQPTSHVVVPTRQAAADRGIESCQQCLVSTSGLSTYLAHSP